jgi:hypothetical protein
MQRPPPLFQKHDWSAIQDAQHHGMRQEIADLSADQVLSVSVDDLCDHFCAKYSIEVPVLLEDKIIADQHEVEIDVSGDPGRHWSTAGPHYLRGVEISVTVPFTGDKDVFFISPNVWMSMPPHADVEQSSIIIRRSGVDLTADQVRSEVNAEIAQISGHLRNLALLVEPYNNTLRDMARQMIEARRNKLLKDQNLVAALGFPLKQRSNAPQTYVAPEVRRKIRPTLPAVRLGSFTPEPALSTPDYEHILKVIDDMAQVMERSPSAFASIDEESLRSHFLVQLNGHYEGQATGETFNYEGKTDILIRVNGKNIFIGECKYWDGPKKLIETLDQLAAQTSWRDTKVAVIIFNRRKDFSSVLKSIKETIPKHTSFKREVPIEGETKFRYVFGNRDDPNRELLLTVLAFDVPTPQ